MLRTLTWVAALYTGCSEDLTPAADMTVMVRVVDAEPAHVYAAGEPLRITVEARSQGVAEIEVQWVQADGSPLRAKQRLTCNRAQELTYEPGYPGYYGLVFSSDEPRVSFPPQSAGFPSQTYGFAVLHEPRERALDRTSPFGMVHADLRDPYLAGHIKTLTWNTTSPRWWKGEMDERREAGLLELPIVSGRGWDSNDHAPIPATQLAALGERFAEYFTADPTVGAWELGIEENGGDTYFSNEYYFANLKQKAKRIRETADSIQPGLRLVYNTRGFDYAEIKALFASGSMESFQVFSAHPYRWKEFETPDLWLAQHVRDLRRLMELHGLADRELWFTEVGLPVRGNRDPDGFFGYPKHDRQVPGATPDYAARYLVKLHLIALSEGVNRIYWYNYQDRGNDVHYAEDHFGLRAWADGDALGHPRPSYVAYATLVRALAGKLVARAEGRPESLRIYECTSADEPHALVAWTHPEAEQTVPWAVLREGLSFDRVTAVYDIYGTPRAHSPTGLTLATNPVYVEFRD